MTTLVWHPVCSRESRRYKENASHRTHPVPRRLLSQQRRCCPLREGYGGRHSSRGDLFHAINSADYLFTAGELGGYVVNDFYQIHLNDTKKKLGEYLRPEFPNASRETCEGEAASRIVAFAKSHDIDLIMMPTHGLGPFRRFLIGSITAKVLHDAHCPVWTGVHMEAAPPREAIKLQAGYFVASTSVRRLTPLSVGRKTSRRPRWQGHDRARGSGY